MSPNAKKAIIIGAVAVVLFFLITAPHESANAVHTVLGLLQDGAEALVTFVKALFN